MDMTWIIIGDFNAVRNSPDLILKGKVKRLRMDVKYWISIRLSSQREAKDRLSRVLVDWDIKAEAGLLNHFDIDKREEWVMDLQALDQFNMASKLRLMDDRPTHSKTQVSNRPGRVIGLPVQLVRPPGQISKAKKDAPKEPPKDWTVAEETALCQAWCDMSENNIAGNNMKTSGFWDAVITYFERETCSTSGYDSIVSKCVTPSSNVHWIAQRN
ncbi:hypothetical protein Tco_0874029 [Tanacetum coccineum]|uniref:Uncharacterized protein n=1 Tax=Tanacetum coccineum TaxID=301880 RepID=A0ABQ5BL84_9ASTR